MRSIDVALQGVAKLPPKVRGRVLRYVADQVADRLDENLGEAQSATGGNSSGTAVTGGQLVGGGGGGLGF